MSRTGFYTLLMALACSGVNPAMAQTAAAPEAGDKTSPVTGESNPNPHFRKCMMRDLAGAWEMVGVSGKVLNTFPNDPICHKYQWLIFEEGLKLKHIFYKEEKDAGKVKSLARSTPAVHTYALDKRGVLTFTQADGKVYQICMISSADDGNSKAGDMLLTSYHSHKPALFRLFRKSDKP